MSIASKLWKTLEQPFCFHSSYNKYNSCVRRTCYGKCASSTVFGMGTFVSVFILDIAFPLIFTSIAQIWPAISAGKQGFWGVWCSGKPPLSAWVFCWRFRRRGCGRKSSRRVADSVTLRTAKYMSSTFIPVAGKMVGDTMDMFSILCSRSNLLWDWPGQSYLRGGIFAPN